MEEGERLVEAIKTDYRKAELAPAERAMLDFAIKLTHEPAAVEEADIARLRAAGWDDVAIHDLVQATALFAYYNRLANGLGVEVES